MTITATDITREHYDRPEVKEVIQAYCMRQEEGAVRTLSGGDGWYVGGKEPGMVRLSNPCHYDRLIAKHRTLYSTIDLLDPAVMLIEQPWDDQRGSPEHPIGTFAECLAFTLSVDIDSVIGQNGEDITTSPAIKAAVEAAGQFFVDDLREHGITKSVHCLYSGGGIYIHIHHTLFRAGADWTPENRVYAFRSVTMAYNGLITEIERKFFEAHPEHLGKVKFDKLNNQKRKFKVIFSIHKRLLFAVIPLNPDHIEIDFNKARLPLSSEVLAEGRQWYQSYDLSEKEPLKALLAPFAKRSEEELRGRKERTGDYEISRAPEPIAREDFPSCMKNIMQNAAPGRGPHRALAVLAAYLYQAGWPGDEAFRLWEPVADRAEVEARIFDQWYGEMSCPNCQTIQSDSAGYPSVGLGGLSYCMPSDECDTSPCDYGITFFMDEWCRAAQHARDEARRLEEEQVRSFPGAAANHEDSDTISEEEFAAFKLDSGPKFTCNLPGDNFISRFMQYGSEISDAYNDYWFAGAIFALGVVTDKKLKFSLRQMDIFTNIFIYIAGGSTLARKTTVHKKTARMLEDAIGISFDLSKVPNEFSPEAFIEHMDSFNHAAWVRDEAAGVLSLMRKDYMRGFKDTLMQLYDCTKVTRMLRTSQRKAEKTRFNIADPYLNVFFASTDASLGANTEANDALSGFLARFLFFYPQGEKTNYMPLSKGTAYHSDLEEIAKGQLKEIVALMDSISGCLDMNYTPEAQAYYENWQERRERELAPLKDGFSSQIFGRLIPGVIKFAMLFEVATPGFSPATPIRLEYFVEACRLMDEYFLPMARAVYDLVGQTEEKNVIDKIIAYLKRNGGRATQRETARAVKIKSKELAEYISTMLEYDMITQREKDNGGKGRNQVCLFLKEPDGSEVPKVPKVSNVTNVPDNSVVIDKPGTLGTLARLATLDTLEQETGKTAIKKPKKDTQGLQRPKAGARRWSKNTCRLCAQQFDIPLEVSYHGGGYICERCRRDGAPAEPTKADSQTNIGAKT